MNGIATTISIAEELRPAMLEYDVWKDDGSTSKTECRVLVHASMPDADGYYGYEEENGLCGRTSIEYLRFLDSGAKFREYAWGDEG